MRLLGRLMEQMQDIHDFGKENFIALMYAECYLTIMDLQMNMLLKKLTLLAESMSRMLVTQN